MYSRPPYVLLVAWLSACEVLTSPFGRKDGSRQVFAHYMLGLTSQQGEFQWRKDMEEAKAAGIEGFALNMADEATDPWNAEQLALAYDVADDIGFGLFLSFDQAVSDFTIDEVIRWINEFKDRNSQVKVNGSPLVSTFEGPGWADNWAAVREGTGGIYLVPDWESVGPEGVGKQKDKIDGACKWT
jgi:glucan endo-1,3-alpha-glucosidase